MDYKEKLLQQIEDARQWANRNLDEGYRSVSPSSERMVLCSQVPPELIEECTFIDKLEYAQLDVYASALAIQYCTNLARAKKIGFDLKDFSKYKKQRNAFILRVKEEAEWVFDTYLDRSLIPIMPVTLLVETLEILKRLNYSEEKRNAFVALVDPDRLSLPPLSKLIEARERREELALLIEMWEKEDREY